MTPHPNTTRLRSLMAQHNVTISDVAALLSRKEKTVRMWRSRSGPAIPDTLLELLGLKLTQKAGADA